MCWSAVNVCVAEQSVCVLQCRVCVLHCLYVLQYCAVKYVCCSVGLLACFVGGRMSVAVQSKCVLQCSQFLCCIVCVCCSTVQSNMCVAVWVCLRLVWEDVRVLQCSQKVCCSAANVWVALLCSQIQVLQYGCAHVLVGSSLLFIVTLG